MPFEKAIDIVFIMIFGLAVLLIIVLFIIYSTPSLKAGLLQPIIDVLIRLFKPVI